MALNINTNIGALGAAASASSAAKSMEAAMERLASGQRINSAADDAAGVSISTRMEAQIRGLNQAIRNAGDGQSLVDTAEGAMTEITNMLQRMRELSVQASNDTLNVNDRAALDKEMTQLKTEIDRISSTTKFNGKTLLDGTASVNLQLGAFSGENMSFAIKNLSTSSLGTTNSALTSNASLEVTARGTAAVANVTNLTFNGNDTYSFKIVLDGQTEAVGGAADKEINITATMAGNDATAIAQAINNAVAGNASDPAGTANGANIAGILTASASGNTVTLTAADGKRVDISAFTSVGNGSMTVNQISNSAADSVTLEDVSEQAGIANTGGTLASPSGAVLQLDEDKKFQFRVNGTLIAVTGATGDGVANAAAIRDAINAVSGQNAATVTFTDKGSVHTYEIQDATGRDISISGFQKVTTAAVPNETITFNDGAATPVSTTIASGEFTTATKLTGGTALSVAAGKTGTMSFSNQDLVYTFTFDSVAYTVDGKTKDFQSELTRVASEITAAGGTGVSAINRSGVLEIANTTAAALDFANAVALSAPGAAAVTAGNAYYKEGDVASIDITATGNGIADEANVTTLLDGSIVQTTNGSTAVASQMTLDIQGNDRYTFVIDKDNDTGTDATITADVIGGDLSGLVNAINAHSSTTGIVAAASSGQVALTKADGSAFALHSFSAQNSGSIVASNALGQGGAKVLENAGDGAAVAIAASGAATATAIELSFSGADKFSFQITDGNSTAIVRATDAVVTNGVSNSLIDSAADTGALLGEITTALNQANMSHITVAQAADGKITLTNVLGGALDVVNFKSDATGTITATPLVGQGVGTILNDDALSTSSASIAQQNLNTAASAQLAIDAIDRAMENVNAQRSELGAISNRLDHTIANLTNVSVNTSAAQGRIQDADFAAESTNLAKAQILQQASMAMLAQANASKQGVLSLLQG